MSVWSAILWGGLTSASLFAGQALAGPLRRQRRITGLIMGFGAGALLSAVAYELVPIASLAGADELSIGVAFALGALVYFGGDWLVDHRGGAARGRMDPADDGSGAAIVLGAFLDGLPEAAILGITLALGGSVDAAFVLAIVVSNVPQGVAGTASMRAAGATTRHVAALWGVLTVACAVVAGAGFALADGLADHAGEAQAFAGGAVLTMLADSLMPEGFKEGGRAVGLVTVAGFLVAGVLAAAG